MTKDVFNCPLFVMREHFIQEIGCLDEIFDFLEEWPEEKRGVAYDMLLRACRDAAVGRFPLGAVRENFERFLRKNNMLVFVEDMPFLSQDTDNRNIGGV